MRVDDLLPQVKRLFLDTAPIIYYVERNPRYFSATAPIFAALDQGVLTAVASPVTLAECLVLPYRSGTMSLQRAFAELLTSGPGTIFTVIDGAIAQQGAALRASYNLGLLDALQAATALATGCDTFLTNDAGFRRVPHLNMRLLDDRLA